MVSKKHKFSTHNKPTPSRFPFVQLLEIMVVVALLLFLPEQNVYSFRAVTEEYVPKTELPFPTPAPFPLNATQTFSPAVTAEGITIVDVVSGVTLLEKNPDSRLFPASTTKIMTALVALSEYGLLDVVTVKNGPEVEGQKMGLLKGETITVENLLYGILVHSANDAAFALASHDPHGIEEFITKMNKKAVELHLTNTHFTNPAGFDDPSHYTTARDLIRLSLFALKNPEISKIVAIPQITVSDTTYVYFHTLKNVNELLGKIPGVSGFKTGFTEGAGQSLVTTVQRKGHTILIVILKSQDRFGETETLLNWVFGNFTWKEFN